jgi:hypothetical protein
MRVLSLIAAVCVAAGGSASAQQLSSPSQLDYPQTHYSLSRAARYAEPPTVPVSEAAEQGALAKGELSGAGAPFSGCGCCGMDCCPCGCGPTWFGSAAWLRMSRSRNDNFQVTSFGPDPRLSLMTTDSVAPDDWQHGFEVSLGRYLNCNTRVAATYWTLDPDHNEASVTDPTSQLISAFNFDGLDFGNTSVNSVFDGVSLQRASMRSEVHNFEVNLWRDLPVCCCGERLRVSALTGFRYFRFTEDFRFSPEDASTFAIEVENNLIGWQVGSRADYRVTCGLSAFADVRFGIYYNDIENRATLQDASGIYANDQFGNYWNISSHRDDFSTLAQLDLGGRWQVNCNWSVYAGYRLVAVSGVALSTEQIPFYVADYENLKSVDNNGHLFLHGAFAGVEFKR